jgi:hypothetical protein
MTGYATERPRVSLQARKQEVLDVLDRLLSNQDGSKSAKVAALREVEKAAKRMADQIERYEATAVQAVQRAMEQPVAAVTHLVRFPPTMSEQIAREIEAIAWNESDLLRDIPERSPDATRLASTHAELAADVWEDRNGLSFGSLPGRVIDDAERALVPRIRAEIDRRECLVRAEYERRRRAGLIDVNGVGSVPSYYELAPEFPARNSIEPDSELPDWMHPEVLLMSTKAALITMWHFECPECGMTDAELGPADTHTLLCEVCLEEDTQVRLKRWPVDDDLSALPARHPA